ncbi:MAG: nuclear transport factor 2 family protein [Anaerolineae bacterium]|nr:nuclear transport factor 2 family protein [Anaerolineae bacterium]
MDSAKIIIEYEERLRAAQLSSDTDELDLLLDEAIIFSALDGSIGRKEDDLNLHRSPDFRITKMEVIERDIVSFDTTVVVNVVMDASAVFGEEAQHEKIRYIRVWHQFSEGWRLIAGSMRAVGS